MATTLNVEVLTEMGFEVPAEATPNDMVVAVRLAEGGSLDAALAGVASALARVRARRDSGPSEEAPPRTTARRAPPAPTRSRWSRCPAPTPSSRRWTPSRAATT